MIKHAKTEHPIQDFVAKRWSPYGFADRDISEADLRSLFEAARWAASSFNEQPWSYIVATRVHEAEFTRLLSISMLVAYFYVGMEWLFIATKPSFMTGVSGPRSSGCSPG